MTLRILAASLLALALSVAEATAGSVLVYTLVQVNAASNQIYGFRMDTATGALTTVAGFPIASGGTGSTAASSETIAYVNGRLYVVNDGSNTLSAFTVDRSTGALTPMPFSPVALGVGSWGCVTVHPSGSPVVVGNGDGSLTSFAVTAFSATLAAGSPYLTGDAKPFSCKFSVNGSYVYAGGNFGTSIAGYSVNATTGVLTALAGSPFNSGAAFPAGYALDAAGRLFMVNSTANQVQVFTTSAGVPAPVSAGPFSAGGLSDGVAGVLQPNGFYMVADRGNTVGVYQIAGSGASTTLTGVAGSPFATGGTFTNALAITPDGGIVVAANSSSRNLTVFGVNRTSGALTSLGTQAANALGTAGRVTGVAVAPAATAAAGDFDGDRKSEVTIYRPSAGEWFNLLSATGYSTSMSHLWGNATDVPVAGDYDGDGRSDLAIYRPSTGQWFIARSSTGYSTYIVLTWGNATDTPIAGADFDGDGRADAVVYRQSTGEWFILQSSTDYATFVIFTWGGPTYVPAAGDYDGDGKTDFAVFQASSGTWAVLQSASSTPVMYTWGTTGDVAVPGDYDGDGRNDIAAYRPSTNTWFVIESRSNATTSFMANWGGAGDVAVPADYDGDGKTDIAVYRPGTGTWFILKSDLGYTTFVTYTWGLAGDVPIGKRP